MLESAVTRESAADIPAGLQSRVDAAAFALLREGRNPTVAQVRARMGGGSPNVVAPALQRWRLTFAGHLDQNAGSALEVIPPGVLEIVQALWSRALFEAHRVRDESRSAADALEELNTLAAELRRRLVQMQEREAALDAALLAASQQARATGTRRATKPPSSQRAPKGTRPRSGAPTKARRTAPKTARTAHPAKSRPKSTRSKARHRG
jgi:uncharacterized coiled-coil protein SlyX